MKKQQTECSLCVKSSENRILLAFLLNLFFTFVETWGGLLTGSITILSDAIHDFGDCIALGMAWRMEKLSKRPPNPRYPFGYRRFSLMAGLVNNLILLLGGAVLIVTCTGRFFCPREINGVGMLIFAVFGIITNGAAMLLTAKGSNINEKTISMHMLEDVLTWMAVLIVGILMCFVNLPILDSLLSMGMTLVIACGAAKNLKRIFAVLTLRSPLTKEAYQKLEEEIRQYLEMGELEALRLYSMDGEDKRAEVEVVLFEELSAEEQDLLLVRIKDCCETYGVSHTMLQVSYRCT